MCYINHIATFNTEQAMTYRPTISKTALDLAVGDIVRFYGARFEIIECKRKAVTHNPIYEGEVIGVNMGRWIDGDAITGYFGPGCDDWNFQGNKHAMYAVEVA